MRTKVFFVTIMLSAITLLVKAQERYAYMSIEFNQVLSKELQISIDGKQYIEEKADYSPNEKARHNLNPFFNKVKEYELQGWELMHFNTLSFGDSSNPIPFAYLRKKTTDK